MFLGRKIQSINSKLMYLDNASSGKWRHNYVGVMLLDLLKYEFA